MSDSSPIHSGQSNAGGSSRSFLFSAVLLAGVGLAFFLWFASGKPEGPPPAAHLPFGAAEQSYATRIRIENVALSRAENYLHQEVTTVSGNVVNAGERSVQAVELIIEFKDSLRQVVLRHDFISAGPLSPGGSRDFEVSLEHIPASWDRQNPAVSVTGLAFASIR